MMSYVQTSLRSELPFSAAAVIAIWALLFVANHLVVRASRAVNAQQSAVQVENRDAISRASRPEWIIAQIAYAAAVFAISLYLGHEVFVFLGGGVVMSAIAVLGLNLQALLIARAMRTGVVGGGSITLSTGLALRQLAARMAGAALTFALAGALLAHSALLGGALLCASTAAGYYRRARRQERAAK
jgi:hypothetical protein